MNTIENIALNKLVPSASNVRKTDVKEGISELADSIATHGLRQNLNVRDTGTGRFEVVAGGRRLRALKLLVKEGLLSKDAEIPCKVMTEEEDAAEISLVENTLRLAMHPDDQFEAFQTLVAAGKGIEDVAARFGVTPAVVERRLKLAKVSPKLRAAYRKDALTLDQMMAFAVSDDHDAQEDVFKNLTNWRNSPREIRAALTQEAVALSQPLAQFVTVDAYMAAGGVIQRDLFDAENEGYMPDRSLVLQLANDRLDAAMAGVLAEGWKWVKAEVERDYTNHYGRVYPSHDAPEDGDEGETVSRYGAEDMAHAGALLRIGHDGTLVVERGLVHPDDREPQSRTADGRKEAKEPGDLPASLIKELSAHRTAAMQAALTQNPAVALAVTVYSMALSLFGGNAGQTCLTLSLRPIKAVQIVTNAEHCGAHQTMKAEAEYWGERVPGNPADLFAWCLEQPQDVLLALLAFCAASSVNAIKDKFDADTAPRLAHAETLAESLQLDMAAQWTPTVEGFYGKLSKATLLHIAREAKATLSIRFAEVKKAEAARHVMKAMAGTGWLPAVLCSKMKSVGQPTGEALAEAA